MSWLFSQALVEACSPDTSLDGEPYAQLSVMPTARPFWRNDKPIGTSRLSQFGLTLKRLTDARGAALLTWYRGAFRARTSPSLEPDWGSMEPVPGSGARWPASFAKWDPATRTWRTAQYSLLGGSEEFSETWPSSGSMRNGECCQRPMLARSTSEKGCGSWPTPRASDYKGADPLKRRPSCDDDLPTRVVRTLIWPTPIASHSRRGSSGRPKPGKQVQLMDAVKMWPTPTVTSNYNVKGMSKTSGNGLGTMARMFPTPAARDYRSPNAKPYSERGGKKKGEQLPNSVGGLLNPPWVEWLMGWPIGWTALEPLETARFLEWRQQHGEDSGDADER